ncbi:MAG: hypothetical protein ACSW8J_06095, partial [bacterium]
QLLMIGPEYTQVAVKTERAAAQLKWTGAKIVTDVTEHREALKAEVAQYAKRFGEEAERVL